MRNIVNISLPKEMVQIAEREVKEGNFATKSEFFRHLVRLWNMQRIAEDIKKQRKDFEKGKGKLLKSLSDLR